MPLVYAEPEIAFSVISSDGTEWSIFHVYKDNRLDNRMTYWYTTDEYEREQFEFDIRTIDIISNNTTHKQQLQYALDKGIAIIKDNGFAGVLKVP